MTITAVTTVMTWVDRTARPSSSPDHSRNSPARTRKRAPSSKRMSSTPMAKRTMPFMTNITPIETMTRITGAARRAR